jgi:chromosome segregation ATPase
MGRQAYIRSLIILLKSFLLHAQTDLQGQLEQHVDLIQQLTSQLREKDERRRQREEELQRKDEELRQRNAEISRLQYEIRTLQVSVIDNIIAVPNTGNSSRYTNV